MAKRNAAAAAKSPMNVQPLSVTFDSVEYPNHAVRGRASHKATIIASRRLRVFPATAGIRAASMLAAKKDSIRAPLNPKAAVTGDAMMVKTRP